MHLEAGETLMRYHVQPFQLLKPMSNTQPSQSRQSNYIFNAGVMYL